MEENPNEVRTNFYLANSYFDTEQYEKALKYYKIRIKLGGWEEEIFYSIYRVGIIYLKLKKYEKAVLKLMNAYQLNPTRVEPLYEIIKHYRLSKNYNLANLFFRQAILIPEPSSSALFVNLDIYRYKLIYEFFIFYFYLNIDNKLLYGEKDIHEVFFKLLNEGYNIKRIINYKVVHNEKFDENFIKQLKVNMPDIVYIYSQNSAFSFLNFIKINQTENIWMNTNLMCIGEKTSSILNEIKWKKIFLFNPGEEEFLLYKI